MKRGKKKRNGVVSPNSLRVSESESIHARAHHFLGVAWREEIVVEFEEELLISSSRLLHLPFAIASSLRSSLRNVI